MSALIAGLDFSSRAIHAALIPLDPEDGSDAPPVTLRHVLLPAWKPATTTPAFRSVERCRAVRDAMRELLAPFNELDYRDGEVVHVCVETPLGSKSRSTVLWELYGAILSHVPTRMTCDVITTNEWRRIHSLEPLAGDWKYVARVRALQETRRQMDEHEAEAYLIARACRARLDKAVPA